MDEYGFFHPEIGYWQTNCQPSAEILAGYPEGTVPVPLKPGAGHEWDGAVWIAPPPDLPALRTAAKAAVLTWASGFGARFTAGYTSEEVASWAAKAAAARALLAGDPQPIVTAEAAVTGEDPVALALSIVAKADLYEATVARIAGLRRATFAAIDTAKTPEAIDAVVSAALASAQAMIATTIPDQIQEEA